MSAMEYTWGGTERMISLICNAVMNVASGDRKTPYRAQLECSISEFRFKVDIILVPGLVDEVAAIMRFTKQYPRTSEMVLICEGS